jgi:hypothetical protein
MWGSWRLLSSRPDEPQARYAVERLAVADAFRARTGSAYGTLPAGVDTAAIVERHRPVPT